MLYSFNVNAISHRTCQGFSPPSSGKYNPVNAFTLTLDTVSNAQRADLLHFPHQNSSDLRENHCSAAEEFNKLSK